MIQFNRLFRGRWRVFEFSGEDFFKFLKDIFRKEQLMVFRAMPDQLGTGAVADQGGDKDVRVKNNLHDTRLNTSSSVKMPCFAALAIMRLRRLRNRWSKR